LASKQIGRRACCKSLIRRHCPAAAAVHVSRAAGETPRGRAKPAAVQRVSSRDGKSNAINQISSEGTKRINEIASPTAEQKPTLECKFYVSV